MQFRIDDFIKPICSLQKNQAVKYPANAYGTVYRVRNVIESSSLRLYEDRALNQTYRILKRVL